MAVSPSIPYCPRCQQPLVPGAMACANCGLAFSGGVPSPTPPSGLPPLQPGGGVLYGGPPYGDGISSYAPVSPPGTYYSGGEAISNASTVSSALYPPPPPAQTPLWGYQAMPGASDAFPAIPGSAGASAAYPSGPPVLVGTATLSGPTPSAPKKPISKVKLFSLIGALLVLLGGGGGVAAYLLTRPQPVITVTSDYKAGSTLAGATGTVLHLTGEKFSSDSTITFLLDGQPAPGAPLAQSNADGSLKVDLSVTAEWAMGTHTITAKDAQDYLTKSGVTVVIVAPGEANTLGPNGAPPDSKNFSLSVQGVPGIAGENDTLIVTGQPDPNGGTICQARDNGQPQRYRGRLSNGGTAEETFIWTCSGTYKGGMLSYTETTTSDQIVFEDGSGITCRATVPYTLQKLTGSFSSPTSISGTYSTDARTVTCTAPDGRQASGQDNPQNGSWTGTLTI